MYISNLFRRLWASYLTPKNLLFYEVVGEAIGTCILVIFGLGVIIQTEILKTGFISISLGWGLAVMMAVFFAGGIGPGLVNPAVTVAFACVGKIKWYKVPSLILSQFLGAIIGASIILAAYADKLKDVDKETLTKFLVTSPTVSLVGAMFDQALGTGLLTSGALAITDKNGFNVPNYLHPLMLGLLVTALVGAFAINAGAALNPARDFGPRLALGLSGHLKYAFAHSNYYFWVPIVATTVGAIFGAGFYVIAIEYPLKAKRRFEAENEQTECRNKQTSPKPETEALTVHVESDM